jgi:serine/threonine-protein kinase
VNAVEQLNSALTGRYVIDRELGRGGMATVYLARDVRHQRGVAVKVLNPELGAVLGVERFLSEIQVTANLQHPNLLPLFDSGEADGLLFYVMPFVQGETLRARLDREKQLPIDEAVRIAIAVLGALDYAHTHGVVHRDLKPENILFQAGQPVVADFGIALAVSVAGGNRVTQSGLSLGTPQYMSPEQATGDRQIDGRSDIYSLAAVLYEMLAGDPPYSGRTAQAIIARLLTERPRSLLAVRDTVPAHVEAAIDRALAKLPADRFATAREFAEALQGARPIQLVVSRPQGASLTTAATFVRVDGRRRVLTALPWAMAALAGATLVWRETHRPPVERPRVRFSLAAPDSTMPREEVGGANIALSPDGTLLVYVGGPRRALMLRRLDDPEPRLLRAGTEGASQPRFSPDGKWISWLVRSSLYKAPVAGGPPMTITDSAGRYSWSDRDQIVFARTGGAINNGLWLISAAGGPARRLTVPDSAAGISGHTWPEVLPGGRDVVFNISRGARAAVVGNSELAVVSLADGKVRPLGLMGVNPRYARSGHIVYGRGDGTISAAPFDLRRLRVTGPAVTVLEGVVVKGGGATEIALSPNGTLAYVSGQAGSQVLAIDSTGAQTPLISGHAVINVRVSPNGERVAFAARDDTDGGTDIWVYNVASKSATRLTNDGSSAFPEWTPDGRKVSWTYQDTSRNEIRWQNWDGSSAAEVLLASKTPILGSVWAPSGAYFLSVAGDRGQSKIVLTPRDSEPRVLVGGRGSYASPALSRDGKWLAYSGNEGGGAEVFVQSMDGGGGRHQISLNGGSLPRWSRDGRTIYYRADAAVRAARLVLSPEFVVVRRDSLLEDFIGRPAPVPSYDVWPSGGRFLIIGRGLPTVSAMVVINWLDELRERMALASRK